MNILDLLNDFTPSRNTAASKKLEMDKILENINKFLSAVIKTRVLQETYWYLVRNNFVIADKVRINQSVRTNLVITGKYSKIKSSK